MRTRFSSPIKSCLESALALGASLFSSGASAVPVESDRDLVSEMAATTEALEADGIAYCGQDDRQAACQPRFYREEDGHIYHVVKSPALLQALQSGHNLRLHLSGDVVFDSIFAPDQLVVKSFTVGQTLQGGVLNLSKTEPGPEERDRPRLGDR